MHSKNTGHVPSGEAHRPNSTIEGIELRKEKSNQRPMSTDRPIKTSRERTPHPFVRGGPRRSRRAALSRSIRFWRRVAPVCPGCTAVGANAETAYAPTRAARVAGAHASAMMRSTLDA